MKRAALALICLALLFAFAGCKPKTEPVAQTPAPAPAVETTPQPVAEPDDGLPVIDINGKVYGVSTSPDFSMLALQTRTENGGKSELLLLDAKRLEVISRTLCGFGEVEWSADSKRLITGDDHGLVIVEKNGRIRRLKPSRRYFVCQFRRGSSSKLLYFNYGTEEIWELNLKNGKEKKIRRMSGSKEGFTGLTQFRGQDVYGEYDREKEHQTLRVRSVGTDKILFRIPLSGEYPFPGIDLQFSPDSKWFSFLDDEGSGGAFYVVSVEYAKLFLRRKYLASYTAPYDDPGYGIQWAPKPAKSERDSDALITVSPGEGTLISALNLESGRVQLTNYPAPMSWWKDADGQLVDVAARSDGIYSGIFEPKDPPGYGAGPKPELIAHFRMNGNVVKPVKPKPGLTGWGEFKGRPVWE